MKKVHINMRPILDGYGVMTVFNSRTRPRVNRVLLLAGSLVANFSQLQTVQLPLSRHWKECGEGGVGWYSPGDA